jgi:hypothetical protein
VPTRSGRRSARAQYPPCTPRYRGVMPAWMLMNGDGTAVRIESAMIRVPFTTTTAGANRRRSSAVSGRFTDAT